MASPSSRQCSLLATDSGTFAIWSSGRISSSLKPALNHPLHRSWPETRAAHLTSLGQFLSSQFLGVLGSVLFPAVWAPRELPYTGTRWTYFLAAHRGDEVWRISFILTCRVSLDAISATLTGGSSFRSHPEPWKYVRA